MISSPKVMGEDKRLESNYSGKELDFGVLYSDFEVLLKFISDLSSEYSVLYSDNQIWIQFKSEKIKIFILKFVDEKIVALSYSKNDSANIFRFLAAKRSLNFKGLKWAFIFNYCVDYLYGLPELLLGRRLLRSLLRIDYLVEVIKINSIEEITLSNEKVNKYNFYIKGGSFFEIDVVSEKKSAQKNGSELIKFRMNLFDLIYVTETIHDIFAKREIPLYLSAGTLLGAIRNQFFIPWDYDVDIASKETSSETMGEIANDLSELGFSVYMSDIYNVLGVFYKGISIDIDFYRSEDDYLTMPMHGINNKIGKVIYYIQWMLAYKSLSPSYRNFKHDVWMSFFRDFLIKTLTYVPRFIRVKFLSKLDRFAIKMNNARGSIMIPRTLVMELEKLKIYNRIWSIPSRYQDYLTLFYGDWMVERKIFNYFDVDSSAISKSQIVGRPWVYK